MKKGTRLNRREFIGGGTAGIAALAGITLVGDTKLASARSTVVNTAPDAVLARRKGYLKTLQEILPHTTVNELTGRMSGGDKDWEAWVARTGELPPDFACMPSNNFLPDPLVRLDGKTSTPITTMEQWARQRQWIRTEMQHWVYGKMPPPPDNLRAVVTATRRAGGVTVREVRLEFGPDHRGNSARASFHPGGEGPVSGLLDQSTADRQLGSTRDSPGLYRVHCMTPRFPILAPQTIPINLSTFTRTMTSPALPAGHGRR